MLFDCKWNNHCAWDNTSFQQDTSEVDVSSGVKFIDVVDLSKQTSLESEAPVDEFDAEQTFPTDEEIAMAEGIYSIVGLACCLMLRCGHC